MGVVFSNGEDFANVRIYSGSAPAFPDLTSVSLFALMANAMVDPLLIFAFNIKSMMKRLKSKKASARTSQTAKSRTNPAAKNQAIKLEHHSLEQAPLRTKT